MLDHPNGMFSSFHPNILEYIAKDIILANSIHDRSWSFYRTTWNEYLLIVESVAVLAFYNNRRRLIVLGNPDNSIFRELDKSLISGSYKIVDAFVITCKNLEQFLEYSEIYADQHLAAVRALAERLHSNSKTHRAAEHQPSTLDKLSEVLNQVLPQPAYFNDLRESSDMSNEIVETKVSRRYWKISPGSQGKHWSDFRNRALIAMHWSDTFLDVSEFPADQAAFIAAAKSQMGVTDQGARSLWDFAREVQIDDGILAYAKQTVLAHGDVTGNYELVLDDFAYPHRRSVEWTSLEPRPIAALPQSLQDTLSRQATLVELTEAQFLEATGQRRTPIPNGALTAIRDQFTASGLHYTAAQIATFYTALQTKGFVVLSGISGTGKSKIATGFVDVLQKPRASSVIRQLHSDAIQMTLKPYMIRNRRFAIPTRYHDRLVPMEPGTSYHLPVEVNGKRGTGRFWFRIRHGREQFQLSLHQVLLAELAKLPTQQPIYVEPIVNAEGDRISEFHILSEVPDSSNSVEAADDFHFPDPNHIFLSVRPDWRDSTSLLGYYNPLTETYEWTDFLRFILRARDSYLAKDGLAWFVILDEMNLAHVEYYFADLLSVIESGRDDEGWTREPLRLTYPDLLDDDVPPREVKLPPNLYVIGTVNMDETTHAFSPKVLDRAFTIELSDVNFLDYEITSTAEANTLDNESRQHLLDAFTRQGRFARIDKAEIAEIVAERQEIRSRLHALNELLKQYRFHFGYRVFDEIAQYLFNNRENGMMPFDQAFDQAAFMKVLPKFNGSRARLLAPLRALLAWTINPNDPENVRSDIVQWLNKLDLDTEIAAPAFMANAIFPTTAARARQMLIALETDGFVSFG